LAVFVGLGMVKIRRRSPPRCKRMLSPSQIGGSQLERLLEFDPICRSTGVGARKRAKRVRCRRSRRCRRGFERVCRCSGCWRKGVGLCGGCSKGIGGACGRCAKRRPETSWGWAKAQAAQAAGWRLQTSSGVGLFRRSSVFPLNVDFDRAGQRQRRALRRTARLWQSPRLCPRA